MADVDRLRHDYYRRVCNALIEYVDRDRPLTVRSDVTETRLEVTFSLDEVDLFHALVEGGLLPTGYQHLRSSAAPIFEPP